MTWLWQTEAIEAIRKAAWRRTPKELQPELTGQIAITLDNKWGHLDPLEGWARSLDGELNILPRAVRNDVVDQARRDRRQNLVIEFRDQTGPDDDGDGSGNPSLSKEQEDRVRLRELIDLISANSKLRALALAALESDSGLQREIATVLGVDERTVRNRMARFRRQLLD